jgi:hypothetical protein
MAQRPHPDRLIGQVPVDTDDDSGGSGGAKPQNNIDDFIVHGERSN